MHFGVRILIAMSLYSGAAAVANEQPLEWRFEPFADNCSEVQAASKEPEQGDFVQHRCQNQSGPPVWLLYQEGVRLSVGIGERAHVSLQYVDASRPDWPIQWGGTMDNGRFGAEFAILRFTMYGDEAKRQSLTVFRLNADGTSCVVDVVQPQSKQNEKAQQMAETHRSSKPCNQPVIMLDQ